MERSRRWQLVVTVGLLAAATATVIGARRSMKRQRTPLATGRPSVFPVQNARDLIGHSRWSVGLASAPIVVVEFFDFQCPYCKELAPVLDSLRHLHPDAVRIVYHNFPLTDIHPMALSAAVAADCAGQQGRFRAMYDVLFARQEDLGKASWTHLATSAGVRDTTEFLRCFTDPRATVGIDRDIELGRKLGLQATPTVIIGARRIQGFARLSFLDSIVRVAMRRQTDKTDRR
jgi:protein-disulfide isomerase